jgi:hypothetical protein
LASNDKVPANSKMDKFFIVYPPRLMAPVAGLKNQANDLKIEYDPSKPDGQFRKDVSIDKMKSLFPEFKATRLYHGIGSTYSILKQTWK